MNDVSTASPQHKTKRGRPVVRFTLAGPKPEFMSYVQIMALLREWTGRVPRYPDWRILVEEGLIPSYPDPAKRTVFDTKIRLYKWPEVEAYYRSVLQPIKPNRAN